MLFASCTVILIKNLLVWLTSLLPLKKKKLALRRSSLQYLYVIVRVIVDFLVPAKLLSQNMHYSSCLSVQSHISYNRPTWVFGRQVGSYQQSNELNAALIADGRRSSSKLRSSAFPNCYKSVRSNFQNSPFKNMSPSLQSRLNALSLKGLLISSQSRFNAFFPPSLQRRGIWILKTLNSKYALSSSRVVWRSSAYNNWSLMLNCDKGAP